jgi:hypothetical protein
MMVVPLTTEYRTASPTTNDESLASPFLSMSLAELTVYVVVVPLASLIVTVLVPTAVTVPVRLSGIPPGACGGRDELGADELGADELGADELPEDAAGVGVVVAAFADSAPLRTAPARAPPPSRLAPAITLRFQILDMSVPPVRVMSCTENVIRALACVLAMPYAHPVGYR